MAGEMLKLKKDGVVYLPSQINRTYNRGHVLIGSSSRAVTGKLNIRRRAIKTTHTISWSMLSYDEAPDGGFGLAQLEELVFSGEEFTLEVNRYPTSEDWPEEFQVKFDPESYSLTPVKLRGHHRRFWQVSVTLLEV